MLYPIFPILHYSPGRDIPNGYYYSPRVHPYPDQYPPVPLGLQHILVRGKLAGGAYGSLSLSTYSAKIISLVFGHGGKYVHLLYIDQ